MGVYTGVVMELGLYIRVKDEQLQVLRGGGLGGYVLNGRKSKSRQQNAYEKQKTKTRHPDVLIRFTRGRVQEYS